MIALDCRTVVELASDYVDRDLDPDAEGRVAAHLTGCDGCERYVEQVRQTVRLVGSPSTPGEGPMSESRAAFGELLATLHTVGDRFAGAEWGLTDPADVAQGLRAVTHLLAAGLETQFEDDAAHPVFRPIVTPWRKALGDNADARYHDAPVHPAGTYRVRGRTAGAVYVSFTVEAGAADGAFPSGTALGRSRARPHGHVRAQPHPRHHPEARRG